MKVFKKRKKIISLVFAGLITAGAFAQAEAATKFERVSGVDRTLTSVQASKENKSDTLVVAPGYNFADILSAMNLVNKYNAKLVLYTKSSEFGKAETDKNIKKVYVVYSDDSYDNYIPFKIDQAYIGKAGVKRIVGRNKYETNKMTLVEAGYKNVGVANGEDYPDALSAYPLLREKNLGLMLVRGNVPYFTEEFKVVYTFGGPNSVSQEDGERIYGKDRYETSVKIAEKTSYKDISFVDGRNFADAMSAVNIVNSKKTDILLTPKNKMASMSKLATEAKNIFVVGGVNSVQDIYVNQIINMK